MAELVSEVVLAKPGAQRSDVMAAIAEVMAKNGRPFTASPITVYRWIEQAIALEYIVRDGSTSASRYYATDKQRIQWIKKRVSAPVSTRPRKAYNDEFLFVYEPNKTHYLCERNRQRLSSRCPLGSAPLSRIGEHDVSLFLSDLAFWSSHLEGNQYDYASTVQLLEHQTRKHGVSEADRIMILNHHDAVRYIIDHTPAIGPESSPTDYGIGIKPNDLLGLHAILSQDLMKDHRHCGAMRQSHVEIRESAYTPPDIPARIAELFSTVLSKARQIKDPWEQALFLNVHIPYLQPFEDCNKRTARVACNIPLLRNAVTPMAWTDVSHRDYIDGVLGVYEHNDPTLLAEVFTEGYLRSSERFSLMQRQGRPDQIAVEYRYEIRKAVREMVLEGRDFFPPNIPQEHAPSFINYVKQQIEALQQNPANAARFGIQPHELEEYISNSEARPREIYERGG
jgi:Fic family protein